MTSLALGCINNIINSFLQNLVLCDMSGTELSFKNNIPRPNDFSRALYTFDIGQNDLAYGFQHTSEEQVRESIPNILRNFSQLIQVKKLTPW